MDCCLLLVVEEALVGDGGAARPLRVGVDVVHSRGLVRGALVLVELFALFVDEHHLEYRLEGAVEAIVEEGQDHLCRVAGLFVKILLTVLEQLPEIAHVLQELVEHGVLLVEFIDVEN